MPKVPGGYLESRRQSILEAAGRVFTRKGFAPATMVEIAAEAGITPGAIYRYFPGKEALAAECFAPSARAVQNSWSAPVPDGVSPLDDLLTLASATMRLLDQEVETASTTLYLEHVLDAVRDGDGAALGRLHEERAHAVEHVRSRVTAAIDADELPHNIDPDAFAGALVSFYFGSRLERLLVPELDTYSQWNTLRALIEFARNGRVPSAKPNARTSLVD